MKRFVYGGLLFAFLLPAFAQEKTNDPGKLTIDRIFASGDLRGESAPSLRWTKGDRYYSLQRSSKEEGGSDIFEVSITGKSEVLVEGRQLVPSGNKRALGIQSYEFSFDKDVLLLYNNSRRVWRQNTRGDYWTYRRSTGRLAKMGTSFPSSTLMFAKLSPDGKLVGYVHENNIYIEPVDGGTPQKLTSDGTAEIINGTFDWVYEEEFDCRDGWRWSPDSKTIAYWQLDSRDVMKFTMINNTAQNYPTTQVFAYPKTGEKNSLCRIGVVSAQGGPTRWMDIPGDTVNDYYVPRMQWMPNSEELMVLRINRLQNNIDVMMTEATTGRSRILFTDSDPAWVDLHEDSLHWMADGNRFTWISERDGFRQLYLVNRKDGSTRKVTTGKFDVIQVLHIDEKTGRVYFIASPENALERYLYSVSLEDGSKAERLTPPGQKGWHSYDLCKDGSVAIHSWSSFASPGESELVSLPDHKTIRTFSRNEKFKETLGKLEKSEFEFLKIDIGQGIELDGWLMKPANFDPAKKYPLIFHVYGEPAAQNVANRWGGSNYLWHRMMTQEGYAVACVDNRGTPHPRGREWRKCVYRQIGTLASEEQAAGAKVILKEHPWLDAKRVGVWGWSGGGSMTLNLLFRSPDIYHTGVSIAPVPDMRLYDTIYQERYMGLPQKNQDDYLKGSPITHAAGLKGNLLVIHGTGDDNCHYQGVERLANRLIELNKPFSMMAYPNRSHAISEGSNTTRHLFSLITRYFKENLPAGTR